jgi:hypothetical protein
MTLPDAKTILAIVGVLFLLLGAWRLRTPARALQARTWLRVGLIFCAVAAWLWWSSA